MTAPSRQEGPTAPATAYKAPLGVLDGPITPTMLRLATPTTLVLVAQTLVGVAETWFFGFLGTEALAGGALVFPALMLMQMTANGGIGGVWGRPHTPHLRLWRNSAEQVEAENCVRHPHLL